MSTTPPEPSLGLASISVWSGIGYIIPSWYVATIGLTNRSIMEDGHEEAWTAFAVYGRAAGMSLLALMWMFWAGLMVAMVASLVGWTLFRHPSPRFMSMSWLWPLLIAILFGMPAAVVELDVKMPAWLGAVFVCLTFPPLISVAAIAAGMVPMFVACGFQAVVAASDGRQPATWSETPRPGWRRIAVMVLILGLLIGLMAMLLS